MHLPSFFWGGGADWFGMLSSSFYAAESTAWTTPGVQLMLLWAAAEAERMDSHM